MSTPELAIIFRGESVSGHPGARGGPTSHKHRTENCSQLLNVSQTSLCFCGVFFPKIRRWTLGRSLGGRGPGGSVHLRVGAGPGIPVDPHGSWRPPSRSLVALKARRAGGGEGSILQELQGAEKSKTPPGQFPHKNRPGNSRTRNRLEKTSARRVWRKSEKLDFRFGEGRNRPRDCDFRNLRQKL